LRKRSNWKKNIFSKKPYREHEEGTYGAKNKLNYLTKRKEGPSPAQREPKGNRKRKGGGGQPRT